MPRPKASAWKARASTLGNYFSCDYRAAFDRAIDEGLLELPAEVGGEIDQARKSSPYADFGTCAHFHMQDGLRCVFPGEPADFAPTPEEQAGAASLFSGDAASCQSMVREVALLGAKHMPKPPDGQPWFSEHKYSMPDMQGHIDFVSQDSKIIVDLKTASRPPDHNRPKPEHLIQLCAYYLLVQHTTKATPEKGYLLYVSSSATWALLCEIDFTDKEMIEYIEKVASYAKYLRSKRLYEDAIPRIGKHCSDGWCPYKAICKEKILPKPGLMVEASSKQLQLNVESIFGDAP